MDNILKCVLEGDVDSIEEKLQSALDAGVDALELINKGLLAGMDEVGILFKAEELYVPEVLMAAQTLNLGMQMLKPLLNEGDVVKAGKIVILTVKGDLHDIGKNLCAVMLEGAGFEVVDLGMDVSPETVCDAVSEQKPDIVGMSALLSTTMKEMGVVMDVLKETGLAEKVRVMVGGAILNSEYAEKIGAHYASDAAGAVRLAKELMKAG